MHDFEEKDQLTTIGTSSVKLDLFAHIRLIELLT